MNPYRYVATNRGHGNGDARRHAEEIVEKALETEVSVLAITDHNDVSGIAEFRGAAAGRPITVMPGVELSTLEGIHVLCIYPPETTEQQLDRYLGEFVIRNPGNSATLSNKSLH